MESVTPDAEEMITVPRSEFMALRSDVTELLSIMRQREARQIPDRPMSPQEVATITGKSLDTVLRWIRKGKLQSKKEGRTILIRPVDLQRFLGGKS